MSALGLDLVCPACRGSVRDQGHRLTCAGCERAYPVVAGIPDMRLRSDRYLTLEEDREKALALARREDLDFAGLVRAYWEMTPSTPPELAEGYARVALAGKERGLAYLHDWAVAGEGARLLDVGCGTGGLLEAAASRGMQPVGVDIALRWLVVARRRLEEARVEVPLIAADGAVLPFRPGGFDVVASVETLEHTDDQRGFLHSCLSSKHEAGRCVVVTSNRFSPAPEPTVRLWGVGLLPRSLARRYVQWRRKTRYAYFRAASVGELRAMLGPRPHATIRPAMLPPPHGPVSALDRAARLLYQRGRSSSLLCRPLTHFAPFLEIRG